MRLCVFSVLYEAKPIAGGKEKSSKVSWSRGLSDTQKFKGIVLKKVENLLRLWRMMEMYLT